MLAVLPLFTRALVIEGREISAYIDLSIYKFSQRLEFLFIQSWTKKPARLKPPRSRAQ